jgi:hypothetical protein
MNRPIKALTTIFVLNVLILAAPPVVTSTAVTSATEDVAYSYTTAASDADNDALTWSVKNGTTLPGWLTFSASGSATTTNFVTGIPSAPGGVGYDENTGYTYFATTDADGTIYKADVNGTRSVFGKIGIGTNPYPVGNMIISGTTLYVTCYSSSKIVTFDLTNQSGSATSTLLTNLSGPVGMALRSGELYVASYNSSKIVRVNMTTGAVTDFFTVSYPFGLVFNSGGDCFVSQFNSHKVLKRTSTGDTSTVATLTSGTSDIKIGKNGKFYISQRDASDFRIYQSDFSSYQSIAVRSWGMTFNNAGTLIFGEYNGTRLLKLETGAVLSGTPTNSDVGVHNVALSVTDGTTTVNHEFTITVANTNDAPTSSNNSISITTQYLFSSANFSFADIDPTSDTLSSIKITSLPGAGSLTYFNTSITLNKVVPKDSLGQLVFTPAIGGSGIPYTTFGFQVGDGTAYSSSYTMTINATSLPTVTTSTISTITTSSAVLGGNVTSDGSASVTERGIVYSITDNTPVIGENGVVKDANGTATGLFSESIGSLTAGTKYYVRAYAINSVGTNYGLLDSFTTLQAPAVTTEAVSSIAGTTATGNGTITVLGVPNPTAHGVCWNTSGTPTTSDNIVNNGAASATGAFTCSITGLTAGVKYYIRAYTTNSVGTSYGSPDSFTTLQAPTVTTEAVSSIAGTTATGNGTITVLGVPNPTAHGVCWNTSGTPTTSDNMVNNGAALATGAFTCSMTGLTAGVTYYARAYVTNSSGTSYGSEVNFTTVNTQTITFNALSAETYGNAPFNLTASASSGLTVSFTSSNNAVATISGNTVTITGTGSTTITASQVGNSTFSAASNVNQILTVNAKTVTITNVSGINKAYDGTTTASLSGTAALSGVESADVSNVTLGGTPVATFADAIVGTGKSLNVTGYSLSGSAAGNYTLTQPSGLTANITNKVITITGLSGVNKLYDGIATATLSGTAALSGVETADAGNVILDGTPVATFADATVGTGKSLNVTGYSLSGSAAGNYTLTQPSGLTANITSKVITITGLSGVNKLYDGTATATLSGTAALSGVETADAGNVILGGTPVATFADATVGTGKSLNVTGYSLSGSAAATYSLIQPSNLAADITPKIITITGLSGVNKLFDGTTTATLSGTAALSGVETADVEKVILGGTPVATFADAVVGTGKSLTVTGYSLSGSAAGNYTLIQPSGLTANITNKVITITGLSGVNKLYDGTATATLSGTAALSGVETADAENVILDGTPVATFADATVGTGKSLTITGYSLSGSAAAKYTLTQPSGLTANITNKVITITGLSGVNKLYDGTAIATLSGTAALSGVETADTGNVILGGTPVATFADAVVGTGKSLTVTGYSLSGSAAGNYTLTQPSGLTANITNKVITITGLSGVNKLYDGTATATLSGTAVLSGVETADAGNVILGGTPVATFADAIVGTGKIVTVTGYTISGPASENYTIAQPSGLTANITQKAIIITGISGANKTYDGTITATLSGTAVLSGVETADTGNVMLGGTPVATFADATVGTGKLINVAGYTISGPAAGSYVLMQPQGLSADITEIQIHSPVVTSIFNDTTRVGTTVRLCWDNVANVKGYRIQISQDPEFTFLRIDSAVGNITRFFANNLGADSTWYFRVAAYNTGVTSQWTSTYHFTTLPAVVVTEEEFKEKVTIQIIDSIETPLPGVSILTNKQNNSQGFVLTIIEAKDIIPDTSIAQVTRVYDFTHSAQTRLQDSIVLTFAIPDTFLDGSIITISDLHNIRIYEIDSGYTQRVIFNAAIDTITRTISYRTNRLSAVTLAFDHVPPTITDNTQHIPNVSGNVPAINGQIIDNIENCRAFAYFRKGGEYEYDSLPVTIDKNGFFSLSVTNSTLDINGFEYFIAAFDGTNRVTIERKDIPVKVTAVIDSTPMPSMQWQLFSTPVNLSANDITAFFRNMGEYGKEWKLFRRSLTSIIDSFVEYGPNLNTLGTGFSYWIKSYKKAIQLSADSGVTTSVSSCYETIIPAKTWAAVGNPYMFPVGWQKIIDSTKTGAGNLIGPYTYEDSAWIPPSQIDNLIPWRGYYVYNSSNNDITMRIPSLRYRTSSGTAKRAVAQNATILEWIISSKSGRDYRNYFGFSPEATDGYDVTTDFPKAGAPKSEVPVAWFCRPELSKIASRFQTDFTSMNQGGAIWTSMIANLQEGKTYECKIAGFAGLSDSIRYVIVDKHAGITHDIRDGVYRFSPLEKEAVREMELIVGTEGFVNQYIRGMHLLPKKLTLSSLTWGGTAIIKYALPWSTSAVPVRLNVLDLQGRLISTLVNNSQQNGYYTALWDIRKTGNASGMYLISLKVGKQNKFIKVNMIK